MIFFYWQLITILIYLAIIFFLISHFSFYIYAVWCLESQMYMNSLYRFDFCKYKVKLLSAFLCKYFVCELVIRYLLEIKRIDYLFDLLNQKMNKFCFCLPSVYVYLSCFYIYLKVNSLYQKKSMKIKRKTNCWNTVCIGFQNNYVNLT